MPPTIPPSSHRLMKQLAGSMNQVQGGATQQDINITTATTQVTFRTGQLQQYPASGSNHTSGWGFEVPSAGLGSAPVVRGGVISWTSPSGGTQTVVGLFFFDTSGNLRVAMTSAGWVLYDTSGNVTSTIAAY